MRAAPIATVSGQSYTFDQCYYSRHTYHVRAFNRVGAVLSDWTVVPSGDDLNGVRWLVVSSGPEPLFDIRILNSKNQTLTAAKLFYMGPTGLDPAQVVASWQSLARSTYSSPTLTGQHAGWYYVEWQTNGNGLNSSGSPAFTIAPTESSTSQVFEIK